jgi:hypothetical protein
MNLKKILLPLLMLPAALVMQAEVRVSLLTCEPGEETYEQYGHTAIRYEDSSRGMDVVFNYGMFSFNAPHFVWRFIKGETDYQLGVMPFDYFEYEYASRGSSVHQQELNLMPAEQQRLFQLLEDNYRPANRTYRYNFFYDNCTTRARDILEKAIDGEVVYPDEDNEPTLTFRDIVHQHTARTPWTRFGIDLLLGAEADAPIGQRERQFAPFHYRKDAAGAVIKRRGETRPLVNRESLCVQVDNVNPADPTASPDLGVWNAPFYVALLYLIIYIGIAAWQIRTRRIAWATDIMLYTLQGLAGCVVTLMFFCSTHPTVGSNWLILLLNPLPMLYLPCMVTRALKGQNDPFHKVYGLYLTIFIILIPVIPQKFGVTVVPLALSLWINSWAHVWVYRTKQKA